MFTFLISIISAMERWPLTISHSTSTKVKSHRFWATMGQAKPQQCRCWRASLRPPRVQQRSTEATSDIKSIRFEDSLVFVHNTMYYLAS